MRLFIFIFFVTIFLSNHASFLIDIDRLNLIENIVNKYISEDQIPGAVVLIGNNEKILYNKAFGNRSIYPIKQLMTLNTIFDLASLTKVIATATSILMLAERGLIYLSEPVSTYIPEFENNNKDEITIEQLLIHTSGLIADNPISDYQGEYETIINKIYNLAPINKPGTKFVYSDVGYIILAELVKRITDKNLELFAKENIFDKLGMKNTSFLLSDIQKNLAAPTERRNNDWIQGEVHDPRAYLLNGITGHAGLFSTAQDLGIFCRMILNKGTYNGVRILSPLAIKRMIMIHQLPENKQRGLGWDIKTEYSSYKGDFFVDAIGHTGFTGTSILIDFNTNIFIIVLTNRIHCGVNSNIRNLRSSISNIVASALIEED